MKSKLLKAVEQTVRKWENMALGGDYDDIWCGFCKTWHLCDGCPIYTLEDTICTHRKQNKPAYRKAYNDHDIPSCLAIMVYVWGFINFGSGFNQKKEV